MTSALSTIDPLRTALANAETIEDLRGVRDMASAARAWAKARGLGIQSENEASEYILRAERRIGQNLISLREDGLFSIRGMQSGPNLESCIAALKENGSLTTGRIAEVTGLSDNTVIASISEQPTLFTRLGPRGSPWALVESGIEHRNQRVDLASLGITAQESGMFQQAAAVPDDLFERMLAEARANVTRLAKVNFYRAGREAKGLKAPPVTPEDPYFDLFRRGIYGMLGWVNNEESVGPTENGLLLLPSDELVQIRVLVEHLAKAWKEATDARR